jgi:hypothetical protein
MDTHNTVHPHTGASLSWNRSKAVTQAMTWKDLEDMDGPVREANKQDPTACDSTDWKRLEQENPDRK